LIDHQVQKLMESKQKNTVENYQHEPLKPEIGFDDFTKIDIRIATILEAERVKGSKKLLKLRLDTGLDQRTVASGIGEYYAPEDIVGQQVCLLANLAPRKMMGIESQGMILMAKDQDGKLAFVLPSFKTTNGAGVS
jgi:methionyl-tRNA synthetase